MVSTLVPVLLLRAVLARTHEALIESQTSSSAGSVGAPFPTDRLDSDQWIENPRGDPNSSYEFQSIGHLKTGFQAHSSGMGADTLSGRLSKKLERIDLHQNPLRRSEQLYKRVITTSDPLDASLKTVMRRGQSIAPVRDPGHASLDIESGSEQRLRQQQCMQRLELHTHSDYISHLDVANQSESQASSSSLQQQTDLQHSKDARDETSISKGCCYAVAQRYQTRKALRTKYTWEDLKEEFKEKFAACIADCVAVTLAAEILVAIIATPFIQQYVNKNFNTDTDLQGAFNTFVLAMIGLNNHMVEGSNPRKNKRLQDSTQDETPSIIQESFDRIEKCERIMEDAFKGLSSVRGDCEEMHKSIDGLAHALQVEQRAVRKGLRDVVKETRRCKAARKTMEGMARQTRIDCTSMRQEAEELRKEIRKCQATRKERGEELGRLTAKQKKKLRRLYGKSF